MNRTAYGRTTCDWCPNMFQKLTKKHRFCCSVCSGEYHRSKRLLGHKFTPINKKIRCKKCDKEFRISVGGEGIIETCSTECTPKLHKGDYEKRAEFESWRYRNLSRETKADGQNGHCFFCGKKPVGKSAALDHIIPISRGGKNNYDNLVFICINCNSSKRTRTSWEFIEYLTSKAYKKGFSSGKELNLKVEDK